MKWQQLFISKKTYYLRMKQKNLRNSFLKQKESTHLFLNEYFFILEKESKYAFISKKTVWYFWS